MTEPVPSRPKVFISYSHADEDWKDRLQKHLSVVAREEDFDIWEDRKIEPGSEWHETIVRQIEEAGIAILLISVDFLSSDFIRNEEVKRFLDRREKKDGLRIYPVIVDECAWESVPWLSRLQVRPKDGQALSQWDGYRLNKELTKITKEIAQILKAAPKSAQLYRRDQFLAAFRRRLAPEYSRWDLGTVGVTQSGGTTRPIEADLDLMYLPLRLAKEFDISETGRGALLSPKDLLARKEPLVVRGPAGAGKTTWIRWMFRQLLRIEGALPLMLVLRDLAARWQDRGQQGAARSLDTFLECWIAEHMGAGWEGVLAEMLAREDGPRPVLLVDGWDELGPLGDELREKLLGFLSQYPRALVVVTSRPYGEGRPTHADRFEVLDIQPLSDSEIEEFTTRFFTHCHGGEEKAVQRGAEHFQRALKNSLDAQILARTALLLTMMLLISRSRPLPDKRHLLYEACIENLLTALPNRKQQEGALLGREQWRPDDSEERMRVVAALAAGLQERGGNDFWRTRGAIVHTWEEMASLLPVDWPEQRKVGFVIWLAGPAGLLTDRTDEKLAFTHLSFQEYLTAWRLNAQVEGAEERVETFKRLLKKQSWWETLRLWAALIEKQSPERLDLVLKTLIDVGSDSLMLTGSILADGLGTEERFRHWLAKFPQALCATWPDGCDLCAGAWSSSRQQERKEELVRLLNDTAPSQTWLAWLRFEEFAELSSLAWSSLQPTQIAARSLIEQINGAPTSYAADVAFSRLLVTGSPIWPINPVEVGLLQVWPGARRLTGLSLQLASTSGATRLELLRFFPLLENAKIDRSDIRDWTSNLARVMADDMALGSAFGFPRDSKACDLARDWASIMARDWARHRTGDWDQDLARNLARYLVIDFGAWTQNVACKLVRASARDLARNWARNRALRWAQYLSEILSPETPWIEGFSIVDIFSFRRVDARANLAYADEEMPLISLFSQASRLSLHPGNYSSAFDQSLALLTPTLDPLWPALARHLARRSTPEDRALLTDLAQHPEKREPPLSWGLQFIVRGDIMLSDGSIVTLDELADEAGLPRLPYLEDMPDELEVDWDGIIQPS